MMRKRISAFFMALVLCLGLAVPALAEETGFTEVIPCQYDDADFFSEGLAPVKKDGKWGYIDKTGKEVVPCQYDNALGFSDGLAVVEKGGKCGYIDKTGKEVIPCKYDVESDFSDGLAAVGKGGKFGFIDKNGKEVTPCRYDSVLGFSDGLMTIGEIRTKVTGDNLLPGFVNIAAFTVLYHPRKALVEIGGPCVGEEGR